MRHKHAVTIGDIYQKYRIPPNLQRHQLRVGFVGLTIAKNWRTSSINPEEILEAGLFHDMGNLIKFNFSHPEMLEGENPHYWQQIQQQFINQYGANVHQATIAICQDIGLKRPVIDAIKIGNWDDTEMLLETTNLPACILVYADMRVGPYGIIPYYDRITNLNERSPSNHYHNRLTYAKSLETFLQPKTNAVLPDIRESEYQSFSSKLLSYQIETA